MSATQNPTGRDLISKLPVEVKDRILEFLPTREAARTALLSSLWNDAWLQHGRLAFDEEFFESVEQCYDDKGGTLVNIINNILFLRAGPVKKFTLAIEDHGPKPQQSDFDMWCLFLSRNGVDELNISLYSSRPEYKLPFCLLACRTIKQLAVRGPFIDLPVNASGIFSNVTSLSFLALKYKRSDNGIASSISIPKLEKLAFNLCGGINKFEISPPKLEILSVIDSMGDLVDSRWLAPHLKAIKTLWLSGSSFTSCWHCWWGADNEAASRADKEAASRLLEDPDGCFVIQELKMLNTIKIESFSDSALIMLFMKMLLSKSPALERVVITKPLDMNASEMSKILRKLECFPRASPHAQIVYTGYYYKPMHEDWLDSHGFRFLEP